jgi:hypothetical protein
MRQPVIEQRARVIAAAAVAAARGAAPKPALKDYVTAGVYRRLAARARLSRGQRAAGAAATRGAGPTATAEGAGGQGAPSARPPEQTGASDAQVRETRQPAAPRAARAVRGGHAQQTAPANHCRTFLNRVNARVVEASVVIFGSDAPGAVAIRLERDEHVWRGVEVVLI